jgi:hypothetical protein
VAAILYGHSPNATQANERCPRPQYCAFLIDEVEDRFTDDEVYITAEGDK